MIRYTDEQKEFLRSVIPGRSYKEIADLFNERFGLQLKTSQVNSFIGNNKLNTGRNGRFQKGNIPPNKGKKGIRVSIATEFKPGHVPRTYLSVGTETVRGEGYIWVKVADPDKWKEKHRIIWEEANGPVPEGYVVIFANRNPLDVRLENLILISRRLLAVLNKRNLISSDPEATRAGIVVAQVYLKIAERNTGCGGTRIRGGMKEDEIGKTMHKL
jgi:hypothetical protein